MGIIFGIPLIAFILMGVSFVQADSKLDTYAIFFACLLTPIIVLLIFNIVQMTIGVIASFFSYVKISPDGIEQKHSPYKHIRCNWSEVDKLGKFFLFTDVVYLHSYEVAGMSLSLKAPFKFLRPKQGFISLTGYDGWSDGQLANDLKQYAPKLFENQLISQETQSENKEVRATETPSESQEVRLLAAFSHASVLFPSFGFFVPIVIYATQKKNSSYLAFQALQALIWQIAMFAFSILSSACMVGSIFIPVLLASSSQNEKLFEVLDGGMFFAIMLGIFLVTFGNIAFIIYGIVGAIMAYQGKDFRYIFIGYRIEKSKGTKITSSA